MKIFSLKVAMIVALSTLAFYSIVIGNSTEPPPSPKNKSGKVKTIKAQFEATKYKTGDGNHDYECEVKAFLTMPKKDDTGQKILTYKFFSCKLNGSVSNRPFCEYTKDEILNEFIDKCDDFATIPGKFGLTGETYIANFKVPNLEAI